MKKNCNERKTPAAAAAAKAMAAMKAATAKKLKLNQRKAAESGGNGKRSENTASKQRYGMQQINALRKSKIGIAQPAETMGG